MAALAGELGEVGDAGDRGADVEHGGGPFLVGGGQHADLDQLAGRQEHAVQHAGIGAAAAFGIEPGGRAGAGCQLVALADEGAAAVRPGRELNGGHRKAATEPDPEQLAGQRPAGGLVAGMGQEPGECLAEAGAAGEKRRGFGRRRGAVRHRPADDDAGPARFAGNAGRHQRAIAANGIDGVRLLWCRQHADQEIGGVIGGRRRCTGAARPRRHQPARDHQGDTHPQIAAGLPQDLGEAFAERVAAQAIDHGADASTPGHRARDVF